MNEDNINTINNNTMDTPLDTPMSIQGSSSYYYDYYQEQIIEYNKQIVENQKIIIQNGYVITMLIAIVICLSVLRKMWRR